MMLSTDGGAKVIPHKVKCRAEAVNNLSRSLETRKMLKIISLNLKFIEISESVILHQTLFQHQLGYVSYQT